MLLPDPPSNGPSSMAGAALLYFHPGHPITSGETQRRPPSSPTQSASENASERGLNAKARAPSRPPPDQEQLYKGKKAHSSRARNCVISSLPPPSIFSLCLLGLVKSCWWDVLAWSSLLLPSGIYCTCSDTTPGSLCLCGMAKEFHSSAPTCLCGTTLRAPLPRQHQPNASWELMEWGSHCFGETAVSPPHPPHRAVWLVNLCACLSLASRPQGCAAKTKRTLTHAKMRASTVTEKEDWETREDPGISLHVHTARLSNHMRTITRCTSCG